MSKNKKSEAPKYPKTIETFRSVGDYELSSLIQREPSSVNGFIRVRKYKVTVELIDEPVEVIQQRIQNLWDYCENYHHLTPLKFAAEKYNYVLVGSAGNKVNS